MHLRKAYAAAVSAVVVGLQLWVIVPPTGNRNWYWPFVDYPMYSTPHYAGDRFRRHRLRVLPCDAGAPALAVNGERLGIPLFRFYYLVGRVGRVATGEPVAGGADTTAAVLSRLLRERLGGDSCAVELWEQSVTIPESGPVERDPPWRRIHAWPLRDDGATPATGGAS